MNNNKEFKFNLEFEGIPIFKGRKLSFEDIKKTMKELEKKFE